MDTKFSLHIYYELGGKYKIQICGTEKSKILKFFFRSDWKMWKIEDELA